MQCLKVVIFFLSLIEIIISDGVKRKISAELNPLCPSDICTDDNQITVIHITSIGEHDTIHYVWDFTGKPGVLIAVLSQNATLSIDWSLFMEGSENSIKLSEEPKYYFGLVINTFWEYNDVNDIGVFDIHNNSQILAFPTHDFPWHREKLIQNDDLIEINMKSPGSLNGKTNKLEGNFLLKFTSFASSDHDISTPHLMHTENTTQIDIIFDNVKTNKKFSNPRLALEMVLFSSEPKNNSFQIIMKKSLDDEYTPGIFEIFEIASPESSNHDRGGFLQYRPVSYTHPERDVSTSTQTYQSSPVAVNNPTEMLNNSIAMAYLGYKLQEVMVQSLNFSFGVTGDGYYTKTNYTTWTFVAGYGGPLPDKLSLFVVIVATIGLGVPLLLICGGGCYLCVKKVRSR